MRFGAGVEGDDLSGSVIAGRYAVLREVGRGTTATLYLATDLRYEREVALKVLRLELTGSIAARRFLDEINTAARLSHPLILSVLDSGEWEGRVYYAMPYVEADSLRRRLTKEGPLPIADAVRIAGEVAEALEFAHRHGVVHRDIKPENILLHSGHAVVADFGIARAINRAGEGRLTAGFALGTPAYMSPEQTYPDSEIDGRTDIYSLGCVLHEMLAGAPPFTGETSETILLHQRDTAPPSLRVARPTVSAALEQVTLRALSKRASQRFQSAQAFANALRVGVSDEPSLGPPTPVVVDAPIAKKDSRRPVPSTRARLVALAAVVAIVTIVSGLTVARQPVVSLIQRIRHSSGRKPANDSPVVVVAPFYIRSTNPDLLRWKEELPNVLAISLDGIGPLRVLSAAGSFKERPAIISTDSALALAEQRGADYVIYGDVIERGRHTVAVSAQMIAVRRGKQVGEIHLTSDDTLATVDQQLGSLANSVSSAMFEALNRVTRIAAVPRAGVSCPRSGDLTRRQYVRAEQFYRTNMWDSARVWYSEVIRADSTCALAYRRLSTVIAWEESVNDTMARSYQLRAGVNNHGLAARDSLLIVSDSMDAALWKASDGGSGTPSTLWALARRMIQTLEEGTRRYPGDPEMWYTLGDARYHWGWGAPDLSPDSVLAPFDSAIVLDSGFALSYLHPMDVSFMSGDSAAAARYIARYLALHPPGSSGDYVRLGMQVLDPRTAFAPATVQALRTRSDDDLLGVRIMLDRLPDSLESALRVSWVLSTRDTRDSAQVANCSADHEMKETLAQRLAYRGHLRAAVCAVGSSIAKTGTFVTDLATLGAISPDSAELVFDGWLRSADPSLVYALPWWGARRDSLHVAAVLRVADSLSRSASAARRDLARYTGASARAYLSLVRQDTVNALRLFQALPESLCFECFVLDRLTTARLLAARGSLDLAFRMLDSWPGDDVLAREVLTALERGRVAERRGDVQSATAAYKRVVSSWQHGDEAVQPYVREAKEGVRRLNRP